MLWNELAHKHSNVYTYTLSNKLFGGDSNYLNMIEGFFSQPSLSQPTKLIRNLASGTGHARDTTSAAAAAAAGAGADYYYYYYYYYYYQ